MYDFYTLSWTLLQKEDVASILAFYLSITCFTNDLVNNLLSIFTLYRKCPKNADTPKSCNPPKNMQDVVFTTEGGFKNANGMANSVDPDQTEGAV